MCVAAHSKWISSKVKQNLFKVMNNSIHKHRVPWFIRISQKFSKRPTLNVVSALSFISFTLDSSRFLVIVNNFLAFVLFSKLKRPTTSFSNDSWRRRFALLRWDFKRRCKISRFETKAMPELNMERNNGKSKGTQDRRVEKWINIVGFEEKKEKE